jgi:hypothetical protein
MLKIGFLAKIIIFIYYMASTRNKNTPGNYCLQQREYEEGRQYTGYKYSAAGEAYQTRLPGNGLNPGQVPWNQLSYNSADIESFLFGVNSTNLVNPQPCFTPELKYLATANIFNKDNIYIPEPLVIEKGQRPFPIP